MNKSKLAVGLMTAVLSVGALAGCDNNKVKYSSDGTILTYTDGNGQFHEVKANDLLVDYYDDSSKYQSIFDAINSIVIKNYFTIKDIEVIHVEGGDVHLGLDQMTQINSDADFKVEKDKKTAETNAENNGTSYDTEFEAILSGKGAEDEEELHKKYVEELQKEKFDENFYKYFIDDVKKGAKLQNEEGTDKQLWTGYFKDMLPYHVSHVLVKLEDGSGTNYSNGTISEDNAKKLYDVVDALNNKDGDDTFRTIARRFSEDTGSAANYGDLGIMDYSTGYVNEFKLGIYAYENIFGNKTAEAKASRIQIPNESSFKNAVAKSFNLTSADAIPEIPFSVFKELKEYSDKVKAEGNKSVLEDSANFYPRNVLYNKYLNRHSVAFITNDAPTDGVEGHTTGFYKYPEGHNLAGKIILSAKVGSEWTPILVTRAGSDYQGIHFIVVNRSPFAGEGEDKVVDGVSLNNYYTTYYPDQQDYPKEGTSPLKTYINFVSGETADTKSRAESLKSTLKSFDSDKLGKYIYRKYFEKEGLKITDSKLADALDKWIDRGFEKKAEEDEEAWEKTWRDYVDTLAKQNDERTKLVSEACKIGYNYANRGTLISSITLDDGSNLYDKMAEFLNKEGHAADIVKYLGEKGVTSGDTAEKTVKELFKTEGGLCNDGKEHL